MKGAMMRLGPWHVVRTLGRDLSGAYHAARRDSGDRATLYYPSGELARSGGDSLLRLVTLHHGVAHTGLVGFHSLDHDDGDVFLIGEPVADALVSLRSGRRPDPGQTRAVGAALAAALNAAHDVGLIHGGLDLDNVLWAPGHPPRILGAGAAALGLGDRAALAHGDVVGLGRLLCALVASWTPRGGSGAWNADDQHTVELARVLADPGAAVSMREAHALLSGDERALRTPPTGTERAPNAPPASLGATRVVLGPYPHPREDREPRAHAGTDPDRIIDHRPAELDPELAPTDVSGRDASDTDVLGADAPPPDPRPDQLGGQLGRYRILGRLGCGGMGEVFLAEDPALRRGVAIKRIRPGLERDRAFRARLRREAQLAARLSHRAIVQVFDLISHDDVDHMVMEYVPGPSLHALLAGTPMPIAEAVRIAAELADGLVYAHQQGVVHRDLKLENILISIDGQPKIADFGIARHVATVGDGRGPEPLTNDGLVVGTSRAMSPEQIEGRDVDARSDLFSFGVLIYEMVTGASPFATASDAMTLLRVLHERHVSAAARLPAVPRALSELIDHLLEKDPAKRPDDARSVRDRLLRMLDDGPEPRRGRRDPAPAEHRIGSSPVAAPGPGTHVAVDTALAGAGGGGLAARRFADVQIAAASGTGAHHRVDRYPSTPRNLRSKIQAPFVLAEIRALRSSIFKKSPEVQSALAIADKVEHAYNLDRADLFIPAFETFCAILEPFAMTVLTGTVRRIGYEIFPQYVSILGIPATNVKAAMDLKTSADLVRLICDAYSRCVVGTDAGTLIPTIAGSRATVTDTTFMPCQLQMGVFLGAGKLTGWFNDTALIEKRCRTRGDDACVYELAL
jgi:serine/threonine-protein kinase